MKKKKKERFVSFRATETQADSIDVLAKLAGTSRSDILRRFIPNLPDVKNLISRVRA